MCRVSVPGKRLSRESLPARIQDASANSPRSPARFAVLVFAASSGLHRPVLAADRDDVRRAGAARRRALHRGVGDLRHRAVHRRHGDVLVAARPRVRLHRREHRRHRRADARVDPRARSSAAGSGCARSCSPRATRTRCASARGRSPRARPSASARRRPARHGRASACWSSRRSSPSLLFPRMLLAGVDPVRRRSGRRSTTRRWRSRTPASCRPARGSRRSRRLLVPDRADDRRLPRRDRLPGDLRAQPQPAPSAAGRCT